MKLVICHSNPDLIERLLRRPLAARHVVQVCQDPKHLLVCVGETEPHLVVLGGNALPAQPKAIEKALRELDFRTRILTIQNECEDERLDALWFTLQAFEREYYSPVSHDPQNYTVIAEVDESEAMFMASPAPRWDRAAQEERFLTLLETATREHRRAKAYLKSALATERSYRKDWSLAALCDKPLAFQWRMQLVRYFAALAHYLPGVDSQCLPLPYPPAGKFDLVPTALPSSGRYAVAAAQWFGLLPGAHQACVHAAAIKVGMTDIRTVAPRLVGWNDFVREAAIANCRVWDACLGDAPALLRGLCATRQTRNRQRLFFSWWQLPDFIEAQDLLENLVSEFRQGRRAKVDARFISFPEFVAKCNCTPQKQRPDVLTPFQNN